MNRTSLDLLQMGLAAAALLGFALWQLRATRRRGVKRAPVRRDEE